MNKKLKLLWTTLLVTFVLVSCEKDEYLKDNAASIPFPYQVTKMSKEEIINSSGNRDLFASLNETTSILSQKTTSSTPLYTILDESATVFTDDNNTFTSYTFKTINTVEDGVLRNIVVTDISNVFTTYLIEYIKQPNGMLGASYMILSNDDSGLLKSTISITTCEDIGYWKTVSVSDDCVCYMEQWTVEEFCNTVTYDIPDTTIDAGNSSNGGGGANSTPRTDSWGTGFPISSGGPTGSPGFVTQPSYADHKEILDNFTEEGSNVVAEINRLKGFFNGSTEKGSQIYFGLNDSFRIEPLPSSDEFGGRVDFGATNDPNELARVHMHRNTHQGVFSVGDLYGIAHFYGEKVNLNANFASRDQTTSFLVSRDGIYAIRVKNIPQGDLLDFINTGNSIVNAPNTEYNQQPRKVAEEILFSNRVESKAKRACNCNPGDSGWSTAQENAFIEAFNYYFFNTKLIVFKGTENSNGSITWTPITE